MASYSEPFFIRAQALARGLDYLSTFFGIRLWFGLGKVLSQTPNATISNLSNVLQEAEPVFSLFFSVLSLAVIFYAALSLQLSFLFLTKPHQP